MPNLLSNRIKRTQLQPADHIYSYRNGHIYSHHGIYIGGNKVIHFTRTEGEKSSPKLSISHYCCSYCAGTSKFNLKLNPNGVCHECGFQPNEHKGVVETCLDCFLKGHNLYRCEYKVSKLRLYLKRPGTCNTSVSDPPEKVIERATYMLHGNCFGNYDVADNNCESFAVYCKTEKRASAQADSYMLGAVHRLCSMVHNMLNKVKHKTHNGYVKISVDYSVA